MKIINYKEISIRDRQLLLSTKKVAERSITQKKHKVGCTIICANGSIYQGATAARTRVIGSTCAERMALDQWYFNHPKTDPITCYLVGTFNRESWRDNSICTPCGVCLEMFLELLVQRKLKKLIFICSNWKLNKVLITDLRELFPQFGKGGWPYTKNIGVR